MFKFKHIGFAIIHLIRNQEVQRRMQMELDQVCGENVPTLSHRSRSVLYSNFALKIKLSKRHTFRFSLPYTEAVLMEAQRCSSIAPYAVPHYAVKDTKLQGYTIPKVNT